MSRLNGGQSNTTSFNISGLDSTSLSLSMVVSGIISLAFAWLLGSYIWYRYLSPISDIPGPFLASFSRLWLIKSILRGRSARELSELHEKHGQYRLQVKKNRPPCKTG